MEPTKTEPGGELCKAIQHITPKQNSKTPFKTKITKHKYYSSDI
jgi:hypothetical protein